MRKIRIGKDIVIRWAILTNGEAIPLDGRNLKLFIIDCIGDKTEMDFTVSGNQVESLFKGIEQKRIGTYRLTLWENYQQENQSAIDCCDAFRLVGATCEENDDIAGIQTEAIINLEASNFEIISKNGIYSPQIKYIHTLTQEEYESLEEKNENTLYVVL